MNSGIARFFKFLASGGLAAAVNVLLRWSFSFTMPFELAVAISYLIAMTVAFGLCLAFVFEPSSLTMRAQFIRFAMVNLVSLVIVWAVSVGLYRFVFPAVGMTWNPDLVSHVAGVLSPALAAYFLHKNFTFKQTDIQER